jgi:hypothetical protein
VAEAREGGSPRSGGVVLQREEGLVEGVEPVPEANPLVPAESHAEGSRPPTFKSIEISVAASAARDQ